MIRIGNCFGAGMIALLLAGCGGGAGEPGLRDGPFQMLVYTRTEGFRHASIEAGVDAVRTLGAEHGFSIEHSEDPAVFTADNLARFEVVMFLNTTLNVLPQTAQRAALENFVRGGGGFVGVHSAADTLYEFPFYGELIGAYFLAHPVLNQPGTLIIEDAEHPSTRELPQPWSLPFEEYYSFRSNPRDSVRVLMNIDESSYLQTPNTSCDPSGATFPEGFSGTMGDHPMSWCHDKFAGRAWYTALGHEIYLYQQPEFLGHLLGGILTAARRQPADCAVLPAPPDTPPYVEPQQESCINQLLPPS